MHFNIPVVTAFLASIAAVTASPIAERDLNGQKNFKLLVTQRDSSIPTPYLRPDGGVTFSESEAGIYSLNLSTSQLSVSGKNIGIVPPNNATVFGPRDAEAYITQSFFLTNSGTPWLVWENKQFVYAQDGIALFGMALSGLPAELLVYAFIGGSIPKPYNQTWLVAEEVIVN